MPKIFDASRVDQTIDVSEREAVDMARKLAAKEAIFGGISSGGCVAGALKLIEQIDSDHIVCVICDRGDRYLSSDLFHI